MGELVNESNEPPCNSSDRNVQMGIGAHWIIYEIYLLGFPQSAK